MSSGFSKLDNITYGLPKGDLIVIAGRPSTGKTSFAINIAYNLLKQKTIKINISIFSLEMTKIQILYKLISIGSSLPIKKILEAKIDIHQWKKIQNICDMLLRADLYINDNADISIENIKSISQSTVKKNTYTGVVIIDYLQLIKTAYLNIDNRQQELTYITRELKMMAQSLSIPVLILSQLNRSIEKRVNKKPILSDLKESGCLIIHNSIEQDADIVMMLYDNNVESQQNSSTTVLDCIISKNRSGPIGSFQLIFYKKNTLFKIPQESSIVDLIK
uniref:DNA replication helicase n=1 Tax=Gloiopeltis furcata TaxID=42017 RepID=UPI0028D585EC|nr:DNA replication helicase [Gloiopeltis furcata]WMP13963.1 DNA replication helicase [Gloiopeltis furcata]